MVSYLPANSQARRYISTVKLFFDYKKKVASMIKSAKSKYFKRLNPSNLKNVWKVVKCRTKQTSSIPISKDSQEKAIHNDTENAQPPLNMSDYNAPVNCMPHNPPPTPCRGILRDLTIQFSISQGWEEYSKSNPLPYAQ